MTSESSPLRSFGLVLHRDGRWTHEGVPIRHRRLREAFDRSVRYLPEEGAYVVQIGRFRGRIEAEEAAFFVTQVDLASGTLRLSDRSEEALEPASLRTSPVDAALLCSVKRDLVAGGLPARFLPGPQAELLAAVEEAPQGFVLRLGGELHRMPIG